MQLENMRHLKTLLNRFYFWAKRHERNHSKTNQYDFEQRSFLNLTKNWESRLASFLNLNLQFSYEIKNITSIAKQQFKGVPYK